MAEAGKRSRRGVFALGGGLAAIAAGWQWLGVRPEDLDFRAIEGAPGWEVAIAGSFTGVSGDALLFFGLNAEARPSPLAQDDLEPVLYGDSVSQLAVFSDFFCPYCRGLTLHLMQWERQGLRVHWHELPRLGPASVVVARASVAADFQGGYAPFYQRLMRGTFRPTARHMRAVAETAGLDGKRLQADMESEAVARQLEQSAAAAARLGLFATPALVVGKRAIIGEVEPDLIETLLSR